ncbi:hypothetical protein ACRRTK_021135 [Alexandromys fortis]
MPARWRQAIRRKGKKAGRTWFQRGEEWLLISPEVVRKGHMGKTGRRGSVPCSVVIREASFCSRWETNTDPQPDNLSDLQRCFQRKKRLGSYT